MIDGLLSVYRLASSVKTYFCAIRSRISKQQNMLFEKKCSHSNFVVVTVVHEWSHGKFLS
jgi:hypothetical protein